MGYNRQITYQEAVATMQAIDRTGDGRANKMELFAALKIMMQQQMQQQQMQYQQGYGQQGYGQQGYGQQGYGQQGFGQQGPYGGGGWK